MLDEEFWNEYVEKAYVPNENDFKRLLEKVEKYKKLYEGNYAHIRNKIFEHNVMYGIDGQVLFQNAR